MQSLERVTITLKTETVASIDRLEKNRSRFIAEAVERELERRGREALALSLANPHAEARELAEQGLDDWGSSLPEEIESLVDTTQGNEVHWVDGSGWMKGAK
jgi:hypothetical protein